jgi:YesN/AraC family two-component response regulator
MKTRILFVDDEPGIRLTLPAILQQHGYQVIAVATVAEAVQQISSHQFDVLIADLNVGEPGDGFTVVSAMRRVQPKCVNIILTGYPAFENALRAIREQVDDFLVKPADIDNLVQVIKQKLANPEQVRSFRNQPLATCLRHNLDKVVVNALQVMKSHPRLSRLPLSDQDRIEHIKSVIAEILQQLEPTRQARKKGAGRKHGVTRKEQGYSLSMLVDDTRAIDAAINRVVRENLLDLDLSSLLHDLDRLNESLDEQLQQSLEAFTGDISA